MEEIPGGLVSVQYPIGIKQTIDTPQKRGSVRGLFLCVDPNMVFGFVWAK